jgi:hypothetical protein
VDIINTFKSAFASRRLLAKVCRLFHARMAC